MNYFTIFNLNHLTVIVNAYFLARKEGDKNYGISVS